MIVSKAIIEKHQGVIGATSEGEGQGCTFFFELPCLNEQQSITLTSSSAQLSQLDQQCSYDFSEGISQRIYITTSNEKDMLQQSSSKGSSCDLTTPSINTFDSDLISAKHVNVSHKVSSRTVDSSAVKKKKNTEVLPLHATAVTQHAHHDALIDTANETNVVRHKSPSTRNNNNDSNSLKVLLADDSTIACKIMEKALQAVNVRCFQAQNGLEALNKTIESMTNHCPFDAVIIDFYMPVMNGPQAIRAMRDANFHGLIVAVTGTSSETDLELLRASGANRILFKPVNLSTLRDALFIDEKNSLK
jgi:CheY-like chemotaxis protein